MTRSLPIFDVVSGLTSYMRVIPAVLQRRPGVDRMVSIIRASINSSDS